MKKSNYTKFWGWFKVVIEVLTFVTLLLAIISFWMSIYYNSQDNQIIKENLLLELQENKNHIKYFESNNYDFFNNPDSDILVEFKTYYLEKYLEDIKSSKKSRACAYNTEIILKELNKMILYFEKFPEETSQSWDKIFLENSSLEFFKNMVHYAKINILCIEQNLD